MKKAFLIYPDNKQFYSYEFFLSYLQKQEFYTDRLNSNDLFSFYVNLLLCILHDESEVEVNTSTCSEVLNKKSRFYSQNHFSSMASLFLELRRSKAMLLLQSSGTTGKAKRIIVPFSLFLSQLRSGNSYRTNIWGSAYHPAHMGGLQVFFQAFFNQNTLVPLKGIERKDVLGHIWEYQVTHVSATPTFYKMILPLEKPMSFVKRITLGGESSSFLLFQELEIAFPKAKINNVFASSETGTLLVSNGPYFEIPKKYKALIKIVGAKLYVHQKLFAKTNYSLSTNEEWISTGDQVEIVNVNQFKFVGRNSDFVNVGGYRVNLGAIQTVVDELAEVRRSRVYARKNRLTGHLVCCEIEVNDSTISVKEIKHQLAQILPAYEVPKIIKVVAQIELTDSGKVKKLQQIL